MTQVKVGAFVGFGLLVLVVSIFMIGSNQSAFQKVFEVHAYFESAQGLNKGAVVSLAGVKVGNIKDITFDETTNKVRVTSSIDSNFIKKIKVDSQIEIRTLGALGDKYIYIIPGTPTAEQIADGGELKSTADADLLTIISKRGNDTEKIFDVINNLKVITDSLAQNNRLPKIAQNLEQATTNLNAVTESLSKTVKSGSLDRSVNKIESIVNKIDRGEGTLGALINDNSLHERLKNILGAGQKNQQVKNILKSSVEE